MVFVAFDITCKQQQAKQETRPDPSAAELPTPVVLISGFTNAELRSFVAR